MEPDYVWLLLAGNRLRRAVLYGASKFLFNFWGKPMKRILIAGAAMATLLATNALAADLAPRPYVKAPIVVDPGYNWTGFYVGINGGYSWGRATETVTLFAPFPATLATFRQNVNGGLFGGQIGYNWQVNPKWVLGLEADVQWTGERGRSINDLGSVRTTLPGGDFNLVTTASLNNETKLPWFATFRGRAGVLADPSLLLYGTAGLAVGELKFTTQPTVTGQIFGPGAVGTVPAGPPVTIVGAALSGSETRVGWTAGAGLEKKFAPNWSAKLEYLYVDLGKTTYFGGTANSASFSFHDHIVRGGINYQFTAGPVVARY
jgi:outer membrane immunogenic protein